ncbi:MAG: type II CAAX prenyl endopeptidase Rce1 family protein [Acidimicrobiales bacterium]|nr:CPBP family intramembrane metalloprotease [Chloroflexota bacterium]
MRFAVLGVLSSTAGLFLFWRYRPRARRRLGASVVVQDQATAVRAARVHARELTGIDVTDWQAFAVPSSDPALLQQAHQLDITGEVAPLFQRWGLLYGWRVRFCGPQDSVAIGLGGTGDVNFLQVSGRRRNAVSALGRPTPLADLPPSIMADGAAIVTLRSAGPDGAARAVTSLRTDASAGPESATFVEETPWARVAVTVESWNERVLGVVMRAAVTAQGLDVVREADRRGRRLQRMAMTGMVLALLTGGMALILARHAPPMDLALGLGFFALAWVMVGDPQMFPRMVVFEFDGRETLAGLRRRHLRQTAMAALLNGGFVTAGVAVGQGLLALAGAPAGPSLSLQLGVGALVACTWLGLTASAYSFLAARRWLAATAELPPTAIRRLGYSWRDVIGASLQSSIGEEVLYRLVIISLAWHLLGQPLVGALVAAALWSGTHDVGDVRPRMVRSVELFILGCTLGLVLVFAGLASAIVAHFLFNLLVLGWPLLAAGRSRVEAAWQ